jgi:hypothetical protein
MDPIKVSVINSFGMGMTLLMCLLMLALPRRYALLPVLVLTCYMSMGQRMVIANLDFTMIRILVMFGWLRVLVRGEFARLKLSKVDKILIAWVVSGTVVYCVLWGTTAALINRLGHAYDAIGLFFLFRVLIRSREDVDQMVRIFAVCIVPLAALIIGEKISGHNVFAIFGGVSEITVVRDGVRRCQGPFAHPILAGTFAATNASFFIALLWRQGRDRVLAAAGVIACIAIAVCSGSSGPVMSFGWAVLGFCLWPLRKRMRLIRWGLVFLIIGLQLVMKAPVWFLIGRISVFDGSTGFFRARLIDAAITNFFGWWLIGTQSTAQWGTGLFDITNQYIAEGVNGGVLTMGLFILLIACSFGTVGRTVRQIRNSPKSVKIGTWALGCALLAHATTYISVSYFDQNIVTWFLLLAIISGCATFPVRSVVLGRASRVAKMESAVLSAIPPRALQETV